MGLQTELSQNVFKAAAEAVQAQYNAMQQQQEKPPQPGQLEDILETGGLLTQHFIGNMGAYHTNQLYMAIRELTFVPALKVWVAACCWPPSALVTCVGVVSAWSLQCWRKMQSRHVEEDIIGRLGCWSTKFALAAATWVTGVAGLLWNCTAALHSSVLIGEMHEGGEELQRAAAHCRCLLPAPYRKLAAA